MEKRGQVTAFIIIGVIIVASVSLFFIFRDKISFIPSNVPEEAIPMTEKIQGCVENTLRDGTVLAGIQGGYVIPPENALETNFSYIAYGYDLGKNTLASKEIIQKEISKYIELTLPYCFDKTDFPEYEIQMENPTATTKINANSISASVEYPFTITNAEISKRINKKYSAEYKTQFGSIYSTAQEIVNEKIQNPNSIDFTYLGNLGYDISLLQQGENILVYSISSTQLNATLQIDNFRFAARIL